MANKKPNPNLHNALVTVSAGGSSEVFDLRDVNFDQKRDKAALDIGRVIIDYIYAQTEGKRTSK